MVSLHYPTISLGFAGFDELALIVGDVKLKAVLGYRGGSGQKSPGPGQGGGGLRAPHESYRLPRIVHLPDAQVL